MNNLELMRQRLEFQGGIAQDKRMINDKYRTFLGSLKYSYQACDVELAQERGASLQVVEDNIVPIVSEQYRALINPDKLKQDYDDKILSIDYEAGYRPGDVFSWKLEYGPVTQWLIYLQAVTEDAYFKGEIRRCRHIIKFRDMTDGKVYATYAAIRGPVETKIENIQKNDIRIDTLNLSLNILIPRNEQTLRLFKRYSEFMFAGKCWRVQAPDSISMEGVIELNAEEYYKDRDTDTDEVKDGLIEFEPIPEIAETDIQGNSFIKPKIKEKYSIKRDVPGEWKVSTPVACVAVAADDPNSITLVWNKATSGKFTLSWQAGEEIVQREIVVESLF